MVFVVRVRLSMSFRQKPAGNPLGTVSRHKFSADWRLLAGCGAYSDLVNSRAVHESTLWRHAEVRPA